MYILYKNQTLKKVYFSLREIARYAGFKIARTIECGGTAMHPELTDRDKQKWRKAVQRL
jgi:hypothetical protein